MFDKSVLANFQTVDKAKLEKAILHLRSLSSITDNILYDRYSKESLAKELNEIDESISYLEFLIPEEDKMRATYTSVWDGGIEITTACEYDPTTKLVSDIEDSDVEGVETLEDEYITLPDGTELREKDGIKFEYKGDE